MTEPCTFVHRIENLEKRDDDMVSLLGKIESKFDSKLDMIIFQINKVAVLEASHQAHSSAMERCFATMEKISSRLDAMDAFRNRTEGMAKMAWVLWGAMGTGVGFLLLKAMFAGGSH